VYSKVSLVMVVAGVLPAQNPVNADAIFARVKSLAGEWQESSTKGWTAGNRIRVLARGSAVLFESSFPDAPDSGMATLMYVDNGRLLLTHYCEARNQPTLIASSASADGNTITFTFLSGTGMKSRDDGHMDKMVLKFAGADSYRTQWTWYSAGTERWLEDIEHRRLRNDLNGSGRQ
jgi:hypothetical protein